MTRPIFLAAPERGQAATGLIDKLLVELQIATGGAIAPSIVFCPHVNLGDPGIDMPAETWFTRTLEALAASRVVVAVVDGPQVDEQVAFLAGYAFAGGKTVVAYRTDNRAQPALIEGATVATATSIRELAAILGKV